MTKTASQLTITDSIYRMSININTNSTHVERFPIKNLSNFLNDQIEVRYIEKESIYFGKKKSYVIYSISPYTDAAVFYAFFINVDDVHQVYDELRMQIIDALELRIDPFLKKIKTLKEKESQDFSKIMKKYF